MHTFIYQVTQLYLYTSIHNFEKHKHISRDGEPKVLIGRGQQPKEKKKLVRANKQNFYFLPYIFIFIFLQFFFPTL